MDGLDLTDPAAAADQTALAADAQWDTALARIAFAPGIMLGAEAMSAEQSYHLRRLTRHQRWLVGPGTVFGLAVDAQAGTAADGSPDVLLTVGAGYAIDGLGREVLLTQPFAISLGDWLLSQVGAPDVEGAIAVDDTLFLRVTVRSQATPTALQPVATELFDSGLDPVVAARIADDVALELSADPARLADAPSRPLDVWGPDHLTPNAADLPGPLTLREQATLAAAADATAMKLQAWLLRRPLPAFDDSPGAEARQTEAARLLLASIHVTLTPPAADPPVDKLAIKPVLAGTAVNNLVRPFIRPNALLAAPPLP